MTRDASGLALCRRRLSGSHLSPHMSRRVPAWGSRTETYVFFYLLCRPRPPHELPDQIFLSNSVILLPLLYPEKFCQLAYIPTGCY